MAKNEKFIYKTAQNVGINGAPVTMLAYFQLSCRALEWHSRGQRFDPAYLHQEVLISKEIRTFLFCNPGISLVFGHFQNHANTPVPSAELCRP